MQLVGLVSGMTLMAVGVLLTITGVLAPIGIPMILVGLGLASYGYSGMSSPRQPTPPGA